MVKLIIKLHMYDLLQVLIVERPLVQNPYKGMTDTQETTYHKLFDTSEIVSKGSFVFFIIAI